MRNAAFITMDTLKGKPLQRSLANIKRYWQSPDMFGQWRRNQLQDTLRNARSNIPFYKDLKHTELSDFPIISKQDIKSDHDAFLCSKYKNKRLYKVSTSGSTGEPFTCFHDKSKQVRKMADLLFYNMLAEYRVGMRHALIRTTYKSKFKQWLQNEVWIDPTYWNDSLRFEILNKLKNNNIKVVIGYPSILADVADYCLNEGHSPEDFSMASFISTSECLIPKQRTKIIKAFGCKVFSRYASEEFGIIGQAENGCSTFSINTGSLIVEILEPNETKPVAPGNAGRVVITDLFLRAMPLIRYDIGDLAIPGETSPDGLGCKSLNSLEGKITHSVFDVQGQRVSPLAIFVAFKGLAGIREFQVAQVGKAHYELRLTPEDASGEHKARARLHGIFGPEARIDIKKLHAITTLSSGKKIAVLNEMLSS